MGVGLIRSLLHEAAIRYAVLRDELSAKLLDDTAEKFGKERQRARERRESWKARKEAKVVGDGVNLCRVIGCHNLPEWRPTLLFPPLDGKDDRIRVETAMLDVCEHHARMLDPETYTENPDVWNAVTSVFGQAGVGSPDPELAEIEYVRINPEKKGE